MTSFTVQCEYPALFRTTITVEADDPEAAAMTAIEDAGLDDGWKSLNWEQPTYVVALAEGEDAEPWTTDADGFDISVIPVPLLAAGSTILAGYTTTRAHDLLAMLQALTAALDANGASAGRTDMLDKLRADAAELIGDIARVGLAATSSAQDDATTC